ncbi:MAG: autotransporter-associated beta strand repeat-containing protein, partial [Verrucomicrobiia bacterium]
MKKGYWVLALLVVGGSKFILPLSAQPYTFTWDPGQTGFNWNDSGNWSGGPSGHWPNDDYDLALFSTSAGNPVLTANVIGNHGSGLGQLDFQTSGWSINNEPGGDYTIYFDSGSYYGYNAIYSRAAGLNYINTKIQFSGQEQNIHTGSGSTLVLAGGITGQYAPIISSLNPRAPDPGAVRLDAASTVSGSFILRQGGLLVRNSNGLGTSGSLYIGDQYTDDGATARLLTDATGITIPQSITVRNYAGHQVNATIGGNQTSGASAFTGAITLERSASFTSANTDGNVVSFDGAISGVGGVTKTGAGTVSFNHANSYQGSTVINAGTLRMGAVGALPASTSVMLANAEGAILDLNDYNQAFDSLFGGGNIGGVVYLRAATLAVNSGDFAGVIVGTGGLTKVGSGTLTLSGPNQHSGPTVINSGTLAYGANDVLGAGAVTVDGSTAVLNIGSYNDTVATVTADNGGQIIGNGTLSSDSSFELKSGAVSAALGGTAGLNKTGPGTVTLGAANTFSGDTRIREGTLALGHGMALQNSTVDLDNSDTGILDLGSLDAAFGGLKGIRGLKIPDGKSLSVGYNNSSTTYAGAISGTGVRFEKVGTGTLTLTGDNLYTGTTKVSGGTLRIGDGGSSGWVQTPIENNAELVFNRGDSVEFSHVISGTGSLTKLGENSTLVLSGNNTYEGNTTVAEGVLLVNGVYTGGGTFQVGVLSRFQAVLGGTGSVVGNVRVVNGKLSPGASIGSFTVNGNVSFDVVQGGVLEIELDAEGAGSSDLLAVTGTFDVQNASLVFSYGAQPDDPAYIFVTYGALAGKEFRSVGNLPPGYRIEYNYRGQNMIAVVVPEPRDAG